MKPTVQIHHSRTTTHIPAHEAAARRQRATRSLPLFRKPTPPQNPTPRGGRKTLDLRFTLI